MSAVTILTGITVTLGAATITLGVAPLVQGALWVSMGLVIMLRLLAGMMLTVIAVPTFYTTVYGGDEVHIDIVLNQFLSESFGVGINAFFFRQLSGDSGDGAVLGDFKGEASGIGPVVYYTKKIGGSEVYFSVKWLKEFDVKNRLEGDHVYASFALSF